MRRSLFLPLSRRLRGQLPRPNINDIYRSGFVRVGPQIRNVQPRNTKHHPGKHNMDHPPRLKPNHPPYRAVTTGHHPDKQAQRGNAQLDVAVTDALAEQRGLDVEV
jgi:hypothetical protein